jgi:AraC-like DNA-binding protein
MGASVEWNEFVAHHFVEHPVFITYHRCQRPQVTRLHRQSGIELHLTHSGRGSFHVEGMVMVQRGRQLVIVNQLVAHQVFADVQSGYTRSVICLDRPVLDQITTICGPELLSGLVASTIHTTALPCEAWQDTEGLILRMLWELEHRPTNWQHVVFGNLINLLVQLQRSESHGTDGDADTDLVSCCLEIIERQLDGDLSVEYLADMLAVSPKYLSSLFSRTVGSRLSDYVWERRIAMATRLLASNQHLYISEVARRCGFKSAAHFSRRFAQATGSTPSTYQAQLHNS